MSFCGIVCRCALSKHTTCKFSSAQADAGETFLDEVIKAVVAVKNCKLQV
jgi:hypothetical protein